VQALIAAYEASEPDPDAPDTLGWRVWAVRRDGTLMSPLRGTLWSDSSLDARVWDDGAAVEGRAGIHAWRCPRDWRIAAPSRRHDAVLASSANATGLVERHGRYVLGEDGWRAERVSILGLAAPDAATAALLALRYPDVAEIIVRRSV
jgi:hypothetical protein